MNAKTKAFISETEAILKKKDALSDLREGDTVEHKILGRGQVIAIDHTAGTYTVKFDKMETPRKMSFKAPLKKV